MSVHNVRFQLPFDTYTVATHIMQDKLVIFMAAIPLVSSWEKCPFPPIDDGRECNKHLKKIDRLATNLDGLLMVTLNPLGMHVCSHHLSPGSMVPW